MTRGDDLRCLDILEACSAFEQVVQSRGTVNEEILLLAAERLLEIIGEATSKCSVALKDQHPTFDWVGIAGLRVVLAHHYHRTEPALIWQFASVEAPPLRLALQG